MLCFPYRVAPLLFKPHPSVSSPYSRCWLLYGIRLNVCCVIRGNNATADRLSKYLEVGDIYFNYLHNTGGLYTTDRFVVFQNSKVLLGNSEYCFPGTETVGILSKSLVSKDNLRITHTTSPRTLHTRTCYRAVGVPLWKC